MRLKHAGATATLLLMAIGPVWGQGGQPKPPGPKERDALAKVQTAAQAQDWKGEIAAVKYVLENFADTQYKVVIMDMAMNAATNLQDEAQTTFWGERTIEADPNNIDARVLLAEDIAQHIRQNDLDKDQTSKKASDYANQALKLLETANTPPPGIPPDAWPSYKKQWASEAHDALGLVAEANQNFPKAIAEMKIAVDIDPGNVILAHLSKAYYDDKQYDDAIATADRVLAMNDAPASVKSFAQSQKDAATKMKSAAK